MTVAPIELLFYAGAILILFLTPGPVWLALMARALSGGFNSAAPLAVGVALGDMLWPLAAIFGLSWILTLYGDALEWLKWVAVGMFLLMGLDLVRNARRRISTDGRLTRPGALPGFLAGITVILANPKAILFYMGVLPGFFDLSRISLPDIVAILLISAFIPMAGNLCMALLIDQLRLRLTTGPAIMRLNLFSGALLIIVGVVIAVT